MDPVLMFFQSFGMTKAIAKQHGLALSPTHNHRSKPINGNFVTLGLLGHPCGYLGILEAIAGDHQCIWINILEVWVVGDTSPMITVAKAHQLKSDDPRTTKRYLNHLQNHCKNNFLLIRIQDIKKIKGLEDLTLAIKHKLDVLDDIQIQGMLWAECQCCKLHTWPYSWMPKIT